MKNISLWGRNNPWRARFIIAGSHLMLVLIAVWIGIWSFIDDVHITSGMMTAVLLIFLVTAMLYPIKGSRSEWFKASYSRRKKADALLVLSATFLLSGSVNQFCFAPVQENAKIPLAIQVVHRHTESINIRPSSATKESKSESLRIQKKNLKHKVKEWKRKFKDEGTQDKNFLLRFFLGMMTIAGMLGFLYLVAGFACQLSCSGMGGLAFMVSIGGLGLAIFLTVLIFRSIAKLRYPYEMRMVPPTNDAENVVPVREVMEGNGG